MSIEPAIVFARYACENRRIFHFRCAKIDPFEREWLSVCCAEPENLKFVESRLCLVLKSLFGLKAFLDGVFVFLAVGWPFLLSFERNVALGEVDSDERDADRIASAAPELRGLIEEVADYAVNLFDHRFCEDLRFRADLNRGDGAARDQHSFFSDCHRRWNELTKCSIAASSRFAGHKVLQVHHTFVMLDPLNEFCRFPEGD
jgi:hypothetical protein